MKAPSTTAFKPQVKRSQRGFSLIECMISMAILTIGLLSLLGVFRDRDGDHANFAGKQYRQAIGQ